MTITLTHEEAEAMVGNALIASGTSAHNAASVARALVAAEVDGQRGHGLSRVASYAAQAASGKVDGHATPRLETHGAVLRVDVANGFAYPAIDTAIDPLITLAQENNIAAAQFFNSHHAGQLGAHVERIAERGFVAIMVANTPKAMAPWGGDTPLFGTNPIAFAAPRENAAPLVIDLSLSKVARGKVMAADKRGDPIPEGWAIDSAGHPTTDTKAALAGSMIPMGDAKGAALALIVETLAATLTDANHSFEATSFFDGNGPAPGVGQLIIILKTNSGFGARIETLISAIDAQPGARLPGTSRLQARARCADELILEKAVIEDILGLANKG